VPSLRLMIDENYWSLAPFLRKAVSWINAATSAECGCPGRTSDDALVAATEKKNRVLLTNDSKIKPAVYKPCTHGGIIYLQSKGLGESSIAEMFRLFCKSSNTRHVAGHLTFLYRDHAIIFTLSEKITVQWHVSRRRRTYKTSSEPRGKDDPIVL